MKKRLKVSRGSSIEYQEECAISHNNCMRLAMKLVLQSYYRINCSFLLVTVFYSISRAFHDSYHVR
jgi:hypothetical protein